VKDGSLSWKDIWTGTPFVLEAYGLCIGHAQHPTFSVSSGDKT